MYRLFLVISFLLVTLSIRFFFFFKDQPTYTDGQPLTLQTTLLSEPKSSGKYQRITARLSKGERVFISAPSYPRYSYGQTLKIQGTLKIKSLSSKSNGTTRLPARQVEQSSNGKSIYTMSYPKIEVVANNNPLLHFITPIRSHIIWLFDTSLPQPAGNLLLGIVFGIDEGMPKAFDEVLQTAGVLHVIAASGMNVTIIGGFLASLFGRILRRQYALVVTIGGIIFYAGLAGFSASIVRASIMGILVFSAQILGRQTLALYGLLLAGFSMLFYQPFLLFDTGFQLSFMATWGLIVFNPLMQTILKRKGWVIDMLARTDFLTTFVAQLATLPILLGTFGSYSPVSIIVNFLLLWTIPILMIIGGIGTIVGLLIPGLGQWVLYLALPLLFYFESIVWFFGSLPLVFTAKSLSLPIVAGYYLLLLSVVLKSRKE
ncbi:MAG: ComEC/Rec2 family competence protein [Candidatus Levybacteria bacterium]|nr:ComEC/Rec2 family competence protein [Candidatus Levybacteria bacterium]